VRHNHCSVSKIRSAWASFIAGHTFECTACQALDSQPGTCIRPPLVASYHKRSATKERRCHVSTASHHNIADKSNMLWMSGIMCLAAIVYLCYLVHLHAGPMYTCHPLTRVLVKPIRSEAHALHQAHACCMDLTVRCQLHSMSKSGVNLMQCLRIWFALHGQCNECAQLWPKRFTNRHITCWGSGFRAALAVWVISSARSAAKDRPGHVSTASDHHIADAVLPLFGNVQPYCGAVL